MEFDIRKNKQKEKNTKEGTRIKDTLIHTCRNLIKTLNRKISFICKGPVGKKREKKKFIAKIKNIK